MEKLVWLFFLAICLHLVFLWPYCILFEGQRANAFSGLLCAIALVFALLVWLWRPVPVSKWELAISLALMVLGLASGLTNEATEASSVRASILLTSGLGGYWCVRVLAGTRFRQYVLVALFAVCLVSAVVLSMRHCLAGSQVDYFLYAKSHPLIAMIVLLSAGPLALMGWGRPWSVATGVAVGLFGYLGLCLIAVDATRWAALVPVLMLFAAAVAAPVRWWALTVIMVILLAMSIFAGYYAAHVSRRTMLQYQEYRFESYAFSLHITGRHPLFGIGLRSPREEFAADYQVRNPQYSKSNFIRDMKYLVTGENTFLTLMTGLGLPFAIVYVVGLCCLLYRLGRITLRPPPDSVIQPAALLLPLIGVLAHSVNTDILLYPQVNWFFHGLLGFVPAMEARSGERAVSIRAMLARLVAAGFCVVGGLVLSVLAQFMLPGSRLPLVSRTDRSAAGPTAPGVAHKIGPVSVPARPSVEASEEHVAPDAGVPEVVTEPGSLTVELEGYQGSPVSWAVAIILDNSASMAASSQTWPAGRWSEALRLVSSLASSLDANDLLAVRSFSEEFAARRDNEEIPLRVSRLMLPWTRPSAVGHGAQLDNIRPQASNSLAASASTSLKYDFADIGPRLARILIITEGTGEWRPEGLSKTLSAARALNREARVDTVAVGMSPEARDAYDSLARQSGGLMLTLDRPGGSAGVVDAYVRALSAPVRLPVTITGSGAVFRAVPGQRVELPPGTYAVTIPGQTSTRTADNNAAVTVDIKPGEDKVLRLIGRNRQ